MIVAFRADAAHGLPGCRAGRSISRARGAIAEVERSKAPGRAASPRRWRAATTSCSPTRTSTRWRGCSRPGVREGARRAVRGARQAGVPSGAAAAGAPRQGHRRAAQDAFGRWMLPVFRMLAKGKALRGTAWDVFGYTHERRLERQMIADYEKLLDELADRLSPATHATAVALAGLPLEIKGFGHIKERNYKVAKAARRRCWPSCAPPRRPCSRRRSRFKRSRATQRGRCLRMIPTTPCACRRPSSL